MSKPDLDLHQLHIDRQPDVGAPLSIRVSFQVNLLLERDSNFPPLARILPAPGQKVALPVFWAEEGIKAPPPDQLDLLWVSLRIASLSGPLLGTVSGLMALLLLVFTLLFCVRKRERRKGHLLESYETVPFQDIVRPL